MERRYPPSTTVPNPLCDRLSREFRMRGVGSAQVRSAMNHKVPSSLNPFEEETPSRTARPAERREAPSPARPAQPKTAAPRREAKPAPSVRRENPAKTASDAAVRRRSAQAAAKRAREKQGFEEIRVRRPFPVAAAGMLGLFVISFMVVILSCVQNYELDSEITRMERQIQELTKLERDLSVELEKRDDIRVIEDIAVNELGMVKNDLVESRFVSVSGGERVDLAESEEKVEQESAGFLSTMLSALGENWERLMEHIN